MSFLRIQSLFKTFDQVIAVNHIDLEIRQGEFFTLLGSSGCGKTTTLRMIGGLERPDGGAVYLGDKCFVSVEKNLFVKPEKRDMGMVFQSYALWPHMTVFENVAYPLKLRGVRRAEVRTKVADVLALVGLAGLEDRSAPALSGGQQQRVALARALVFSPSVLLLDEPLSNLDAKLRLRLRDDLRRIIKQTGVTALYVTHDQAEAVVLGDRIGVMRDGNLLQMAPPPEIDNKPADLFVASFTGASNLLAGKVLDRQGEFGTVEAPSGHRLTAWLPPSVRDGEAVRIAIRPENIQLGANGGQPNHFTARVLGQRYQGVQTVYDLDVLGGHVEALELGTSARYPVDSQVDVVLPPNLCWAYSEREKVEHE